MTKKSLNKLLAVVLTVAICFTTVFGCLMTVSAAESATCYSWSDGTVAEDLKSATINLTIVAPGDMSLGIHSALIDIASEEETLVLEDYEIVSGSLKSGGKFSAENYNIDVEDETVLFLETIPVDDEVVIEDYLLSSITLKLSFSFVDGTAKNGGKYYAKLAKLSLADGFGAEVEYDEDQLTTNGLIDAGCDHVIAVKGSPINIDTNNKYAVYAESYCTVCGEDGFGYQLVPSTEPMNGVTISWSAEGAYDDNLIDPEDGEQKGTADSPIIINSVEELYSLAMRTKWNDSLNNYYKLADGIDNVVLQSEKYASAITILESSDEVNQLFSTDGWYNWAPSTLDSPYAFAGHFDGNGATFYGMYAKNKSAAGLFPIVYYTDKTVTQDYITANGNTAVVAKGEVSVSNLNVTNSYLYGTTRMGFIAGSSIITTNPTATETAGYYADWCLKVENCSVYGNYMYSSQSGTNSLNQNGLVVGAMNDFYRFTGGPYSGAKCAYIKDCLVYGNDNKTVNNYTDSISITGNFGRGSYHNGSMVLFEKLIVLGASPYLSTGDGKNSPSSHASHQQRFESVYTDASTTVDYSGDSATYDITYPTTAITGINANDVKGYNAVTACPNLAWGSVWSYGADGEYPSIVSGESSNAIYWNGNTEQMPLTEEGSDKNPYIVQNAEQLAWLVSEATPDQTFGKYFKIKDGIQNIVLQADGAAQIMALSDVDSVKDYLSDKTVWKKNNGTGTLFCGHFDGNGAAIYGMRADNGALFSYIGLGATIENLAVYNSYCYMNGGSYSAILVGGVKKFTLSDGTEVANTSKKKNEQTDNVDYNKDGKIENKDVWVASAHENGYFTIENVEIANCKLTLHNTWLYHQDTVGILVGSNTSTFAPPHISGLFVHGNDMEYTGCFAESDTYPKYNVLFGYMDNDDPATNPFEGAGVEISHIRNSLILDSYIVTNINGNNELSKAAGYSATYTNMSESNKSFVPTQYKNSTYYPGGDTGNVKHTIVSTDVISVGGGLAVIDSGDNNANIFGSAAKTTCPNLNWGTEWYANQNGYPTLAALEKARVATESNGSMSLIGSNVAYNNNGSLDFNFHFIPVEGYEPVLYVGKADKSGYTEFLTCTDPVPSSARAELGEDAMMFTIPNLSSRDINTVWVPTLVATNGAVTEWGKSQSIALADYANCVLNEDVVYGDDVTEEIKIADKRVAAALLNYADAATLALYAENDVPAAKNKIVYYNGSGNGVAPTKGSGDSENDPIIIETAENLLWILKEGKASTQKYYKVADNIKAFVLQTEGNVKLAGGIDELMSLDEQGTMRWFDNPNKTITYKADGGYGSASNTRVVNVNGKDVTWCNWDITTNSSSTPFMGHFDGNGVAIYGFYKNGGNPSLFGVLKGATIKNLNVKSSYITGYSGGILADSSTGGTGYTNTIENCVIQNCCTVSCRQSGKTDMTVINTTVYTSMGAVAGGMTSNLVKISNCLVSDMIAYNFGFDRTDGATSVAGQTVKDTYYYDTQGNINTAGWAVGGNTLAWLGGAPNSTNKYSNSIVLSVEPYSSTMQNYQNGTVKNDAFSNVYTDQASVNIAWPNADPSKEPFKNSYSENQVKQITDLTSLQGAAAKSTCLALDFESGWMLNNGYPQPVQSGYTASAGGETIYWDGNRTEPTTGDGTKENPIIINTAAELAYVAYQGIDYTTNGADAGYTPKYFKIADGIDKIVLQKDASYGDAISALENVTKVKDYFEKTSGLLQWTDKAFNGWNSGYFGGHFDGNGVEIYGMYAKASNKYLSLFPNVDGRAIIENVSIVNAYMKSTNTDAQGYRSAAFVSNVGQGANGTGSDEWTVTINNCKVANSYFSAPQNAKSDAGVLVAAGGGSNFAVSNCIVYGNEAYYNNKVAETEGTLFGDFRSVSSSSLSNSIILDVSPTIGLDNCTNAFFSNVYTNVTTSFSTVTTIDASGIYGSKATNIVNKLNNANGKTVWYVGAPGEYPGFSEADALASAYKAEYDALVLDKLNVSPKGGTENFGFYSTSINLRANPYMSFIFNFGEAYKTNRNDITVTFTYTVGGNEITKTVNVPAYEEGKDLKADGWSNLATSKKHTYQFTDLPVQALVNGVNVAITYGDESVDCGTYSAKGTANAFVNANKKAPCSYYEICAEATKALVYYTQALTARYGN